MSSQPSGTPAPATGSLSLSTELGEYRSFRDRVADVLRSALIAGELAPGTLYSAPTIAQQLGVSATPVREAMSELANEGMVEVVRNRGFRVLELTERELDEITQLRRLIEVPTVVALAADCDPVSVEELRPEAKAIEQAAFDGDLVAYIEADRRFHLGLLSLAGNSQLVDTVSRLRNRSRLFGIRELAERGVLEHSAAEHEILIDLLIAHDVAGVERLMNAHISNVRGVWAGRPVDDN